MRPSGTTTRKPRADAIRNRERVLEAAKAVFSAGGAEASLEAVARSAGVGIGTLYRHFPTREALFEAVYRREVQHLADLAEQYNLILLEDACQAHGADYFSERDGCWKRAGSMGMAAAFSFYPGKNLGACGEAGAVTTNDPELARKIRMLRDHGQIRKYYHEVEGYNGRLDAIQASILLIKLKYLDDWTLRRRKAASRYGELLDSPQHEIMLPYQPDWAQAVYHLFVVCVRNREQLMKQLSLAGIGTGIHYPIPLHLQRAYNHLGYSNGDFPVSERLSDEVLSLPMGPELTAAQQERVAEEVLKSVELRPQLCAAAAAG